MYALLYDDDKPCEYDGTKSSLYLYAISFDCIMPCGHEIIGLRVPKLILVHMDIARPLVAEVNYIIIELGLSEPESVG